MPESAVDSTLAPTSTAGPTPPPQPQSRLTAWCVRHRWLVLGLSVLLVAGGVALIGEGPRTMPASDQLVGDSAVANRLMTRAGLASEPTETVIATSRSGSLDPQSATELGRDLVAAYAGVAGVAHVGTPFPGKDGRSVVLPVVLRADSDAATALPAPDEVVEPMLAATRAFAAAHPGVAVGQIGPGSITSEINATLGADFQRAELISLPITLLVLLLAFGAVIAAGVPLLLGVGSVAVALGVTAAASRGLVAVDPNTQSLVLLIGLAVGVDYALFTMRRVREEQAAGATTRDAIVIAGATAGRAVVISGLTVVVAMSGMLVAGGLYTSLALGAILVVLAAVLAAATTLPALLAVLGRGVNALRLPFTKRRQATVGSLDSAWGRLAGRVVRRPLVWTLGCGALLLALAAPALGMRTSLGGVETLSQDLKVVAAFHQLEAAVPTDGTAVQVVVEAPATATSRVDAALRAAAATAGGIEHVSGVADKVRRSTDQAVSVLDVGLALGASDERMPALVDTVRARLVPQVQRDLAGVAGVSVHIGGQAEATDLGAWMDSRLPWVVSFVLLLTLVVMTVSFGSLWLAATSVALNVLSAGAAYGVLTLVFGGSWAEGLLDFTSTGAIASWLPMLMFVVLFGLSMDYHVFVLSRVREAYDAGRDPRSAVQMGVARSAGVVTSAAAVMVGVFSVFGTLSSLEMKQLGVGLAAAVLLDATLVRGVMLPAVLSLLGERAHTGPSWVPRLHH